MSVSHLLYLIYPLITGIRLLKQGQTCHSAEVYKETHCSNTIFDNRVQCLSECYFQNGVWADQATTFPSDESLHARKYSSPKNTPQLLKGSHSLPKDAFSLTPRSKSVSSSTFAPAKMENIPKSRGDHFLFVDMGHRRNPRDNNSLWFSSELWAFCAH